MRSRRASHTFDPMHASSSRRGWLATIALGAVALVAAGAWLLLRSPEPPWWKGNLHSHSLWSDGDAFPEIVSDWYKRNGYHFLAISDHNTAMDGEHWIRILDDPRVEDFLAEYERLVGPERVVIETRAGGVRALRLNPLEVFRDQFEEPGRFLLIPAEEISVMLDSTPVHLNATNLDEAIAPRPGSDVRETLQHGIDAVLAQRKRTGRPMFPHVPHPNFHWAVTPSDLLALRGDRFFEVYNGHPLANGAGDATHPSAERFWDIVLAHRIADGRGPIYALAVDDAHQYSTQGRHQANPGRGWIMVRAPELRFEALLAAMEAGDFYATTGVELAELAVHDTAIELEIQPEAGVRYTTRFIGTREGWSRDRLPEAAPRGVSTPRPYSDDIGVVLSEQTGLRAHYALQGDELYVRATVLSSRPKSDVGRPDEFETAWIQPLVAARHRSRDSAATSEPSDAVGARPR